MDDGSAGQDGQPRDVSLAVKRTRQPVLAERHQIAQNPAFFKAASCNSGF
jgi:hypothetical protein